MSTGRHTKPLFELLRDESAEGRRTVSRAPIPTLAPEVKPSRAAPAREPLPVPARLATEAPPPAADSAWSIRDGVVSMSVYAAYLALAGVLALVVLVWVFAYNSGRRGAERDLAARLQTDLPLGFTDPSLSARAPRDPLESSAAREPAKQPETNPAPAKSVPPAPRKGTPGPSDVITPAGFVSADPREARLNYQVLAYAVPQEDALRIVEVLSQNGLDVIGVPVKVDRQGAPDNNPPLYKVVATLGLTSDQYRGNDPLRARQESEVRRIGQIVKGKVGGRDFASTYWENLKP